MKYLNDKDIYKIKKLIKYKLKLNNFEKKKYFLKIKKIIIFSKKNLNFLYYDQIYFFFKKISLNYIKKIILIIKKFNITIFENIPERNFYIKKNNFFKKKYKKNKFKIYNSDKDIIKNKNENIIFNYKKINIILKKIKNKIFLNFFIFKLLISEINFDKKIIEESNDFNYIEKKYFKIIFIKNNKRFIKNVDDNFFYKFNNLMKSLSKKKNNIFNEVNDFNLFYFNNIYSIFLNYYDLIKEIRYKLYDSIINLSDISFIKFNFMFNKYGSDINWMINLIDFSNFNYSFKNKYFLFIKKKKCELKNIEKKIKMPLSYFLKIFCYIDLNKFKIDIITNSIIENNLHLVNLVANKYYNKDLYKDYIQVGIIGLINSVNKFNYKYKNFDTFSILNIKSSINKFIYKNNNLIRLPAYITTLAKKVNKTVKKYLFKYKENPSLNFIKKKTNLSENEIKKILNLHKESDLIENELNNNKIYENLKDENITNIEDELFKEQIKNFFKKILNKFKEKERKILSMIYGINDSEKYSIEKIKLKYDITLKEINNLKKIFISKITEKKILKRVKKVFNY